MATKAEWEKTLERALAESQRQTVLDTTTSDGKTRVMVISSDPDGAQALVSTIQGALGHNAPGPH